VPEDQQLCLYVMGVNAESFLFVNNDVTHFGHVFLADIKPSLLAIIGTTDEAYGLAQVRHINKLRFWHYRWVDSCRDTCSLWRLIDE
jgi:hypothetical protein